MISIMPEEYESHSMEYAIELFEKAVGSDFKKFNMLMLKLLGTIRDDIPDVGIESMETAKNYWQKETVSPEALLLERKKCWNYLDSKRGVLSSESKEYIALRLVICVLYSEPNLSDFISNTIEFFIENIFVISKDDKNIILILDQEVKNM